MGSVAAGDGGVDYGTVEVVGVVVVVVVLADVEMIASGVGVFDPRDRLLASF